VRRAVVDEHPSVQVVGQEEPLARQSDETLVDRCNSNDHQAFEELVNRYKHRVHWVIRRMMGSNEEEDLAQEVFLRVYEALPNFRKESKFSTWIYKITRNLCLLELRKTKRRGEHLSLEEEGEEKVHWLLRESDDDMERQIERRDISNGVRQLINQLPEQYRTTLTLFYMNQASYEEIADIMEIPLGTVKTYIHRARLRLRDMLLAEADLAGLIGETRARAAGEGE
jgi:RNA polymerase sigma-70 factor (ECF subfamily)